MRVVHGQCVLYMRVVHGQCLLHEGRVQRPSFAPAEVTEQTIKT